MKKRATLLALFPQAVVALATTSVAVNELKSIASASAIKVPGSLSYLRTWRLWSHKSIELIRSELVATLPTAVDREALRELSYQLGVAADVGAMPSFEHEGALSGYAVGYFCRAQLLADLLFCSKEPAFLVESVEDLLGARENCRVSSLGGGPGYDFVAATMISVFKAQQRQVPATAIHATVFDYEQGWSPLVSTMSSSVDSSLGGSHSCSFAACDITVPLSDPVNAQCRSEVDKTDLWVCSYCVAENAKKLRKDRYVFFDDLFREAKPGALFVFTETTHRVWPELMHISLGKDGSGFDVAFPRSGARGKAGRQMVLQKRAGAKISDEEKEWCEVFGVDNEMHKRKIQSGNRRQPRKVRGAK